MSGCASLTDGSKQYVGINSSPEGAAIFYDGKSIGTTPAIVRLPRNRNLSLLVGEGQNQKSIDLEGEYRWGRSFFGNFGFLAFMEIGWVTDFITKAAYQYGDSYTVSLDSPATGAESITKPSVVVAIAPPLSPHPNISDELGLQIGPRLQQQLGDKYSVIPYAMTSNHFEYRDVDYDSSVSKKSRPTLYGELNVQKIYFSNVDLSGETVIVKGQVEDYFSKDHHQSVNFQFDSEDIKTAQEHAWIGTDSQIFYWLPNSIALEKSESGTRLTSDKTNFEAESSATDDFWGQTASFFSAFSIRRVAPPASRESWKYRFAMIPTASFSRQQERFPTILPIATQSFIRTHMDAGFGPNFNYGSKRWNFYFNIIPVLSYDSVATNASGKDIEVSNGGLKFSTELGIFYFITERWHARVFIKNVDSDPEVWEKAIEKSTNSQFDFSNTSVASSGISVGYIIPNRIINFWDKSKKRKTIATGH